MATNSSWLGYWQQQTLSLPVRMTYDVLNGIHLEPPAFPASDCVIDASAIEYVDSVGLAALIALQSFADDKQVHLHWQHLPEQLTDLLTLYDIDIKDMIN